MLSVMYLNILEEAMQLACKTVTFMESMAQGKAQMKRKDLK